MLKLIYSNMKVQYSKTEYFINLLPMQIENFKMLI